MAGGYKIIIHIVYIYTGLSWKDADHQDIIKQPKKRETEAELTFEQNNPDLLTDRRAFLHHDQTHACESDIPAFKASADSFQRQSFRKAKGSGHSEWKNSMRWGDVCVCVCEEEEEMWEVYREHEERHCGITSLTTDTNYAQPTKRALW